MTTTITIIITITIAAASMMRNMKRGVPNLFKEGTTSLSGLQQVCVCV
jgi:hypothetical protein